MRLGPLNGPKNCIKAQIKAFKIRAQIQKIRPKYIAHNQCVLIFPAQLVSMNYSILTSPISIMLIFKNHFPMPFPTRLDATLSSFTNLDSLSG